MAFSCLSPQCDDVGIAADSETNEPQVRTLEEMDMLIRTASSFLWITDSTPEVKMRHDERDPHYRTMNKLNRIATLLITKDTTDGVAVMASALGDSTQVLVVSSDIEEQTTDVSAPNVSVTENSIGSNNDETGSILPPVPEPGSTGTTSTTNAIRRIVEKGVRPLNEHAAELQGRLNDYLAEESPIKKKEILEDMSMFTYLQCQAKILQRLKVPIHPFSKVQFYEAFRPGNIDVDKLSKGCIATSVIVGVDNGLGGKLPSFDERHFAKRMKAYTGFDFKFDDRNHVILDDESVAYFHNYIWKLLSATMTNLEALRKLTNVGIVGDINVSENNVRRLLVTVHRNFSHLSALVSASPTLQKHINNPSIRHWLVEQGRTYELKRDRAEITKDERYSLEDENVLTTSKRVCLDPTGSLLKWLQLCTHWTKALADITSTMVNPITICVIEAPQTPHRRKQASLDALLNFVLDNPSQAKISEVRQTLQQVSKYKFVSGIDEFSSMWQALTKEDWAAWEGSFTGKLHCESVFAWLEGVDLLSEELVTEMSKSRLAELQETNVKIKKCYPLIGVSKACCLLCANYISHKGALSYLETSGRVFPWVMPAWETDWKIFEKILVELKEKVNRALRDLLYVDDSEDEMAPLVLGDDTDDII